MKQLNYREQLKLAQKNWIDPTELYIAEEVETMAIYQTEEEFENTCKFIKKISTKAQEYSISAIIGTIEKLIYTKRLEISDIIKIKPKEFMQHLKAYIRG